LNAARTTDDEDLLPFAVESLEVNLLQVSLAESGFTFTTVINSRSDPELASRIRSEVAQYRNRWLPLRSKLNAVDAAIQEFQKIAAPPSTVSGYSIYLWIEGVAGESLKKGSLTYVKGCQDRPTSATSDYRRRDGTGSPPRSEPPPFVESFLYGI
jgi:hypothetical protein